MSKTNQLIMRKRFKQKLHKRRYTNGNNHMKKRLPSLVIREMQITAKMRLPLYSY